MDALAHHDVLDFGGIEPNPTFETCMKAVDVVSRERIGFLVALGGGSVLDGTKLIGTFNLVPFPVVVRQQNPAKIPSRACFGGMIE